MDIFRLMFIRWAQTRARHPLRLILWMKFSFQCLSLTDHLLIHRRRPLQIEMASCDSMWVILPFLVWAYSKCSNWRGNEWWNKHIWCFDHYFKHVGPNNACERIFRFEHFMTDLLNLNEHYNRSSIIHLLTFLAASSQAFWLKRKYFDFQNRVTNNNNFLTESWPKLNLYHSVRQFFFLSREKTSCKHSTAISISQYSLC